MWGRGIDGQTLQFRLIGINNQNVLMEDLETGSWWQQISGEAISGPLKGRRLTPVLHDEVTFGLWRGEHPATRVLGLDAQQSQIETDWEVDTAKARVVTPVRADDPLTPRTLVVGVTIGGEGRAYPHDALDDTRVILDELHGVPLAVLKADDGHSVRVFSRALNGQTVDLLDRVGAAPARYIDGVTGSEFDFAGQALTGPLAGQRLSRVPHVSDYWFDWRKYHETTSVYRPWQPRGTAP